MKKLILISLTFAAVFAPDLLAAVDMSNVSARASSLNMTKQDYAFAMAIAGTFSGALLGLFIWKVK
ncbi:hypothetical protein [Sulfuricurvum sp.]|uniref:hypothetical protein n=1 Tax=Sulfuricurvum sp. TaxID=2025608 RepID=UPI003BB601CC